MKHIKVNDECRCSDNKRRYKADPIEIIYGDFLEPTQEYENSPPKDSFAVQKDSSILTRKFALVPETTTLHERKQVYSQMTDKFVKIVSLKNLYIKKLIEHATSNNFERLDDFRGSSVIDAKRVYDLLNLSSLDGSAFSKSASKSFKLKERVKQCANFEAFNVVRNWLVRNENLRVILDFLIAKLELDNDFALKFLAGKRFSSDDLNEIWGFETNFFFEITEFYNSIDCDVAIEIQEEGHRRATQRHLHQGEFEQGQRFVLIVKNRDEQFYREYRDEELHDIIKLLFFRDENLTVNFAFWRRHQQIFEIYVKFDSKKNE